MAILYLQIAAAYLPCSARSAACSSDELAPVAIFTDHNVHRTASLEITQLLPHKAAHHLVQKRETSPTTVRIWTCICPELRRSAALAAAINSRVTDDMYQHAPAIIVTFVARLMTSIDYR